MARFTDIPDYFADNTEPTAEQADKFIYWLQLNCGRRCIVKDVCDQITTAFIYGVYNLISFNEDPICVRKLKPLFERFPNIIASTLWRCIDVCSGTKNWNDYLPLVALIEPTPTVNVVTFYAAWAADNYEKYAKFISVLRSNDWRVEFTYSPSRRDYDATARLIVECATYREEVAKLQAEIDALRQK